MREILRAENIKKSYGDKAVLADISITLNEGELVSILGVSGVGKTTLFNVLSGIVEPDTGTVVLEDEDITGKRGMLSYMLQKDLLLPHKTVVDNVALPLTLSGVSKKEARDKASQLFDQFGLEGTEKKYPSQLYKKVALLDEPFSALDAITRSSVQDWYLSVMSEIKLSTLFITHDIDEAILLSDRIYIMKGSPAVIDGELVISTPKPRTHDFMMTDEFLEFKKKIRDML